MKRSLQHWNSVVATTSKLGPIVNSISKPNILNGPLGAGYVGINGTILSTSTSQFLESIFSLLGFWSIARMVAICCRMLSVSGVGSRTIRPSESILVIATP